MVSGTDHRDHPEYAGPRARPSARGALTPVIDRVYPLEEAAAAVRHLESGHPRGKLVVTI
ncbi:zinc-binding dehydrogenase [Streptomyces phaeolivaceus]|uniref:Zinc-binding dehydrogenase n=1 Tax=Streptomyces phaeolivaceus TaxID=2653200 RepID=A0A5P8KGR9_9ACTN|nr:zinc-binding dehydrogenase [Streptomyces phaeolivaceus]QFR02332.1 zinc-binding dehydrogenase [Streptomyces phaeolivaceus]